MPNQIEAKFFQLFFSPLPKKKFNENIESLQECLRDMFPTFDAPVVKDFKIDVDQKSIDDSDSGHVLHMIDAEGKYGIKVNNTSLNLSVSGYDEYCEMLKIFEEVCNRIKPVLNITHFSRVIVRNINVFDQSTEQVDTFINIKNRDIWGRQDFESIKSKFVCTGAATRHEYLSDDKRGTLHIASSVVMSGRSYIPQDEWNIWQLRGNIPSVDKVKLLIDLASTYYQHTLDDPSKRNNVSAFEWDLVKESLDKNHEILNSVYDDIIE